MAQHDGGDGGEDGELDADGNPRALFVRDGDAYVPTAISTGPWSPDALHGGPVAALLAHALGDLPTAGPMFPARFTLELLRPVGLTPLLVDTRVVRGGRKVQVLEATLTSAADPATPVARATLQQIHEEPVALPADVMAANGPAHHPDRSRPPAPENCPAQDPSFTATDRAVRFHNVGVEHRSPEPLFSQPGPSTDWIRVRAELCPGVALRPHDRVVAAADFGNGVSRILPVDRYAFVNPDLTVHLYRLPVDEWVCLDAITRLDPRPGGGSVGLAESALYDRDGRIGRSAQSLIVTPLR
jgi:hypothetical protein